MLNKKIIIDIPFNISFANHFEEGCYIQNVFDGHFALTQTKEWIDYRIDIFMNYTAKSLIAQTNQDFLCFVRYSPNTEALVLDAISRYPKLPPNIMFTTQADRLREEVMKNHDYLYHVIIDSDNMYEAHFIDQVHNYPYEEGLECLLCHEGYIYDVQNNRIAEINHYSPSFYVYIYNKEDYAKYFKERLFEPHGHAELHVNKPIEGRSYVIVTHESNLDNHFDFIVGWLGDGTCLEGEKKEEVLKAWNIQ